MPIYALCQAAGGWSAEEVALRNPSDVVELRSPRTPLPLARLRTRRTRDARLEVEARAGRVVGLGPAVGKQLATGYSLRPSRLTTWRK